MSETTAALPRLNEPAPAFNARTTHGDRTPADYKGRWLILFSHPAEFAPVCTTEFIGFAKAADTQAVRSTFFIDPKGVMRAMVYCPMSNGRSIDEFVRLLGAMQTSDKHSVATPEGWKPGQDVIVPPPKTADAAVQRGREGYKTTDWYCSTKSL